MPSGRNNDAIDADVIDIVNEYFPSTKVDWDAAMVDNCRRDIISLLGLALEGKKHQSKKVQYGGPIARRDAKGRFRQASTERTGSDLPGMSP